MNEIDFTRIELIDTISTNGRTSKQLTLTSWNGQKPKLDLRTWKDTQTGLEPCRGITLNREEAEALCDALKSYLTRTERETVVQQDG